MDLPFIIGEMSLLQHDLTERNARQASGPDARPLSPICGHQAKTGPRIVQVILLFLNLFERLFNKIAIIVSKTQTKREPVQIGRQPDVKLLVL